MAKPIIQQAHIGLKCYGALHTPGIGEERQFAPERLRSRELLPARGKRHNVDTRKLLQTTNSPAPECRRRLEPPPSLAQRFHHRNLVAGLPAGHCADGKMKRGLIVLPDGIEQLAGTCDVARASQTVL